MNVANLVVELDLDSGKLTGKFSAAGREVELFARRVGTADKSIERIDRRINGFGSSLRDFFVILGQARGAMHTMWDLTGRWVAAIIKANAELERQTQLLRGMSTAQDEAGRMAEAKASMDQVLDFARQAPFAIGEIGNAFVKMKSAGIDPMAGAMQSLLDGVAAFGGDDQIFHRATIAIQQMAGKGVVSMEELRQQLGEAIPNAMPLMARAMGISMGQLVKAISTGKVEANDALRRMLNEFKVEFGGAAQNMMSTWNGLISQLKTEWLVFSKEIGGDEKSGFFAVMKEQLASLVRAMQSPEGKQFARDIGDGLKSIAVGMANLAKWLVENRALVAQLGQALMLAFGAKVFVGFVSSATSAVAALAQLGAGISRVATAVGMATGAGGVGLAGGFATMVGTLKLLAGPLVIGAVIAAMAMMVMRIRETKEEAMAAEQAYRDFVNAVTKGDTADLEGQLAAKNNLRKLEELYAQQQRAAARFREAQQPSFAGGMGDGLRDRENAYLATTERLRAFAADIGAISPNINASAADIEKGIARLRGQLETNSNNLRGQDRATQLVERVRMLDEELAAINPRLKERVGQLKATMGEGADPAEFNRERAKIYAEEYDGLIANLRKQKAQLEAIATAPPKAGQENDVKFYTDLLGKTNAALGQALQEREDILKDFNTVGAKMVDGGGLSKEEQKKADKFSQFYATLTAKIAGLEAQLEDANVDLEKFNALKDKGVFGPLGKTQIDEATDALNRLNELKKKIAIDNANNNATDFIREQGMRLSSDLKAMNEGLSGDIYDSATAGMIGLNRQIAEQEAALVAAGASLDGWAAKWEGLRQAQSRIDAGKFVQEMRDMTREINTGLIRDPRARAAAELEFEVSRIRASVDAFKEGSIERVEAERAAQEAILALRNEYAERTKPAWRQLLDDWKLTSEKMEQVTANAIQGLSDKWVEFARTGKTSFSDLITSVLLDIVRIQQNKVWASFIETMVSAFAGSFGGGASAGTGTSSGAVNFSNWNVGKSATVPGAKSLSLPAPVPQSAVPGSKSLVSPSQGSGAAPNMAVNIINQSGTQVQGEKGGMKFDGKQWVLDIVLTAMNRPGSFRDGMKGAMS
jgi:tape measure domain-containing protein